MSLPASVLSYFSDEPTEMATDLLLAKKRPTVPEDVAWNELRAFYKASLAAKQIEAEHAIFLNELWDEVCEPMAAPWRSYEPHQQTEDCATDIRSIWDERCFTREFLKDDYKCEVVTCIGKDEGIQVGYGLWYGDENLLQGTSPDGWEVPDAPEDLLWSAEGLVLITQNIDLAKLRKLANEGKRFVLDVLKNHIQGV